MYQDGWMGKLVMTYKINWNGKKKYVWEKMRNFFFLNGVYKAIYAKIDPVLPWKRRRTKMGEGKKIIIPQCLGKKEKKREVDGGKKYLMFFGEIE